jgi:hypothetical protein
LDEGEPVPKFQRTVYRHTQPNDSGRAHWNDDNRNSPGAHICAVDAIINTLTGLGSARDHFKVSHKTQSGISQSALVLRKLRGEVTSGTYVVRKKRLENWKEKISNLDVGAWFNSADPWKVFHGQCSTWLQVKEPGNTTCFKQHIEACQVKLVPVGGMLVGMGWLKVKDGIGVGGNGKDMMKDKVNMPCHGVLDMDNLSINHYLKQMGAGGGGGQSIHVISREWFEAGFRYLTCAQKEEVQATQRVEWVWRTDHLNLQVYTMNCEQFTSSRVLASSLCTKC